MTAHAMKGDRERCLVAGMDGYVAKPIQAKEVLQAIEEVLVRFPSTANRSAGANAQRGLRLNRTALLARVDGDRALLREIVELFCHDHPRSLEDLREAIAAGDAAKVERLAHMLKGSIANFEAAQAVHAAERLEAVGR